MNDHTRDRDGAGDEGEPGAIAAEESISSLEERIAKAVAICQAWRRTELGEGYMEAYDLVEALQLQLRQRLQAARIA